MIKALSLTIVFGLLLFLGHNTIITNFFAQDFFYQLWEIYTFLTIASVVIILIMHLIHKNFPDKTGFAFMGLSIFKIGVSIIFFIPLMKAEMLSPVGDVLNFFIPYFLYLLTEVVFAVRLINSK